MPAPEGEPPGERCRTWTRSKPCRPKAAGSERTCCLVFKDRAPSRALLQARFGAKKASRRRGPLASRVWRRRSSRLSVGSSFSSFQLPLRATSKYSSGFGVLTGRRKPLQTGLSGGVTRQYSDDRRRTPDPRAVRRSRRRRRNLRRPTCRTAPSSRSGVEVELVGVERLAVEAHPALAQQPPGLAAGDPEMRPPAAAGRCTLPSRQVGRARARPPRSPRAAGARLCTRSKWASAASAAPGAVEALHDPPRRARASASTGGSAGIGLLAQQQLVVGPHRRVRARSSACRTSPPAAPSRPT